MSDSATPIGAVTPVLIIRNGWALNKPKDALKSQVPILISLLVMAASVSLTQKPQFVV